MPVLAAAAAVQLAAHPDPGVGLLEDLAHLVAEGRDGVGGLAAEDDSGRSPGRAARRQGRRRWSRAAAARVGKAADQ